MRVQLIGTGLPTPDPMRAGPATLIEIGGRRLLIDCGDGAARRLMQGGTPAHLVDGVLITHLHSDHTLGLPALMAAAWVLGRTHPLRVWGPRGTDAMCRGILEFMAEDIRIRSRNEFIGSSGGGGFEVTEIEEGGGPSGDGWAVSAFDVEHPPVTPAFGFKATENGVCAVVSGDTRPCDAIVREAAGADLLVHECMPEATMELAKRMGLPQAGEDSGIWAYHTSDKDLGRIASEAGVKRLAVTHLPPATNAVVLEETLRVAYSGEIVIGSDLAQVLP